MSIADPQTITVSGVTTSLPRVGSGVNNGSFQSSDGNIRLSAAHAYGKRIRRNVRVEFSKIAADPLISAQSIKYSTSLYLVLDEPITGFTRAEQLALYTGFINQLNASSNAVATKWLGGES